MGFPIDKVLAIQAAQRAAAGRGYNEVAELISAMTSLPQ